MRHKEFKNMDYRKKRFLFNLYEEKIDGFLICIVSLGTHPCAYIGVPKGHVLENISYNTLAESDIYGDKVNGGFTYSEYGVSGFYNDIWFLGWDYAHFGDWFGGNEDVYNITSNNKKWTTKEIYQEALEQLEELRQIKKGTKEKVVFKLNNSDNKDYTNKEDVE